MIHRHVSHPLSAIVMGMGWLSKTKCGTTPPPLFPSVGHLPGKVPTSTEPYPGKPNLRPYSMSGSVLVGNFSRPPIVSCLASFT